MTFIELRRIVTKGLVMLMLVFIIPVFIISSLVVGIDKPVSVSRASDADFNKMQDIIYYNADYVDDLEQSFKVFESFLTPFFSYGALVSSNQTELKVYFGSLNTAFKAFYLLANEYIYNSDVYISLSDTNRNKLKNGISAVAKYIEFNDDFDSSSLTLVQLEGKMEGLSIAWMEKGGNSILSFIQSARNVEITEIQRAELKLDYNKIEDKLTAMQNEQKKTEFTIVGYEYLDTKYRDFAGFKDAGAADTIKILSYMIDNEYTWLDFSRSYSLGKNASVFAGTTVYDFIFKNFVYILIFLILFSIIVNATCIFSDIKNNTIITPLLESRSRMKVLFAKVTTCSVMMLLVFGVFLTLFAFTAISAGAAVAPPPVLTTFMGAVVKISPLVLLLLYILLFYLVSLLAGVIAALFSISANSLGNIVFRSFILTIVLLGCAGGLMAFMGMLNIGSAIDVLVLLPIVMLILVIAFVAVIRKFNIKDF